MNTIGRYTCIARVPGYPEIRFVEDDADDNNGADAHDDDDDDDDGGDGDQKSFPQWTTVFTCP